MTDADLSRLRALAEHADEARALADRAFGGVYRPLLEREAAEAERALEAAGAPHVRALVAEVVKGRGRGAA